MPSAAPVQVARAFLALETAFGSFPAYAFWFTLSKRVMWVWHTACLPRGENPLTLALAVMAGFRV